MYLIRYMDLMLVLSNVRKERIGESIRDRMAIRNLHQKNNPEGIRAFRVVSFEQNNRDKQTNSLFEC
jgi:hypothetical protein